MNFIIIICMTMISIVIIFTCTLSVYPLSLYNFFSVREAWHLAVLG